MSHLDQKRAVIEPLLESLRKINPGIGYYSKSILSENSNYIVKLSNGKIEIPKGVVDDFELNPGFVTPDVLRNLAETLQADIIPITNDLQMDNSPIDEISVKPKRTINRLVPILSIIVIVLIGYLVFVQIQKQKVAGEREENAEKRAEEEHKVKIETQTKEEKEKEDQKKEEDKKRKIRNNILSHVIATTNNYKSSNLGGIYDLEVTIWNNTDYLLNNVKVRVKYVKPDGQVWNNRDIDFSMISPQDLMTIKTPDTERGVSVEVQVLEVKSTELGL